ncbi:MAG: 16S rRNA (guanine(527)-N(7))-methyltransferase RsmG [Christensenellaceae bacterium]
MINDKTLKIQNVSRETSKGNDMTEFEIALSELCTDKGYDVSEEAIAKMNVYYDEMVTVNKLYNLTSIVLPKDAALKHFFDSIVPYQKIPKNARVADVGSGAGFPIAPLVILRPDIYAAAIESSKKKCDFIVAAAQKTGIHINVLNARAEEIATGKPRETFDVCVSRAVAPLNVLIELCAPLVKNGGLFMAYKGDCEKELEEAQNAVKLLNLRLEEIIKMPHEKYTHHVLVFKKLGTAALKYPRRYSQIIKNTL